MNVLNVRVDDRLVHGCVATLWAPKLNIQRIICIDDNSANSVMLKNSLRMATPKTINLSVLTEDKALENLLQDRYQTERVMIVVKSPKTIVRLMEGGFSIQAVVLGNLGNLTRTSDSVKISRYITVTDTEYKNMEKLDNFGVKMIAQLAPDDQVIDDFFEEVKRKMKR